MVELTELPPGQHPLSNALDSRYSRAAVILEKSPSESSANESSKPHRRCTSRTGSRKRHAVGDLFTDLMNPLPA